MTAPKTEAPAKSSVLAVSMHRVNALSDGVFAIVMTLLVLELKIPDFPRNVAVGDLSHALAHERPVFFSFFITFLFAALFWYLHHVLLNFVREIRPKLVVLNLAFLMFVSLLPFSVGILGRFMQNPLAQTLYFGNYFAISTLLWVQWLMANRYKVVVDPEAREARTFGIRLATIPLAALIAGALAWISVLYSFYAFMMVMIVSRVFTMKRYGKS